MGTATRERRTFRIRVTYFKPSGKYYTHDEFDCECTDCGQPGHPCCYMQDAANHLRSRRGGAGRDTMPGLQSAGWDGFILIDCDEGHPHLLLPSAGW